MSGGWKRTFTLSTPGQVVVSFRYRLKQTAKYESDEYSEMLFSVDGVLKGRGSTDYVRRITGDGNGGSVIDTGWQTFEINLGTLLPAPTRSSWEATTTRRPTSDESTRVLIDDLLARAY